MRVDASNMILQSQPEEVKELKKEGAGIKNIVPQLDLDQLQRQSQQPNFAQNLVSQLNDDDLAVSEVEELDDGGHNII